MKTERYIDNLIQREKRTEPNPFLSERVMAQIGKEKQHRRAIAPVWQAVVAATSLAAVAFLGIIVGNSYLRNVSHEMVININDSQIESLEYYNFEDYE